MRGKEGVFDTTRLLRSSPFGEWVNVFFDPKKITEAQLLRHIKARNCPRAQHITSTHALNPFIAAGDPVQLSITVKEDCKLNSIELPKNWNLLDLTTGTSLPKGPHTLTITTSKRSSQGSHPIKLVLSDGTKVNESITVVRQIGKH